MSEDSFERRHGRFVKASDSWQSGVDGAKPGIIMPAHSPPATSTGRSTTCPGGPRRGSCALTQRAADRALRQLRAPARLARSPLEPQTEFEVLRLGCGRDRRGRGRRRLGKDAP